MWCLQSNNIFVQRHLDFVLHRFAVPKQQFFVTVFVFGTLGEKKSWLSFRFVVCLKQTEDDLSKKNRKEKKKGHLQELKLQEKMQKRNKISGKWSAEMPQRSFTVRGPC